MPDADTPSPETPIRVGCVSYLNAKPLIHGLAETLPDTTLHLDVPARLLSQLEAGGVDLALCPVIDLDRSAVPLEVVPLQQAYYERVVSYTVDELRAGRTPSPDIFCITMSVITTGCSSER